LNKGRKFEGIITLLAEEKCKKKKKSNETGNQTKQKVSGISGGAHEMEKRWSATSQERTIGATSGSADRRPE
jgi:hypothetical protein